jgi:parallel beta-helix repeat protein
VEEIMVAKTTEHWLGVVAISALGIVATAPAEAASPTPISACPYTMSSSGNYVVTTNLTATGTCITIRGRNFALDLQGHTITGNGHGYGIVCSTEGVICDTNVVANGTVTHFSTGVYLDGNYNTVAQITAQQNTDVGIYLQGDVGNVITGSVATKNGDGILSSGSLQAVASTIVNGSQSNNNAFHGIAGVGLVSNSTANNNQGLGINNGVTVINSTAKGNGAGGIFVSTFPGLPNLVTVVVDSTASANGGDGIESSGNVINSTANNNANGGIRLHCPVSAYGNTAINNPGGDISPTDNTCVLLDNKTVGGP